MVLNIVKMAKGGSSHASLDEMQSLCKKPRTKVQEEKKRGVECPGYQKIKAAMERDLPMLCLNHTAGCPPGQNATAMIPQTRSRRKGTGAPAANEH